MPAFKIAFSIDDMHRPALVLRTSKDARKGEEGRVKGMTRKKGEGRMER